MGKKVGGDQKKGDGGKKEDGPIKVVLEFDMPCKCQGCANKVESAAKEFKGVQEVKVDSSNNKLTVVGKVDPEKIRKGIEDRINKKEDQIKKKVVLVSPLPKKDKADEKKKADENQIKKKEDQIKKKVVFVSPLPKKDKADEKKKADENQIKKKEDQIKKKVVLVSPLPKKDKADEKKKADENQIKKKEDQIKKKVVLVSPLPKKDKADEKKKADDKNPKEPVVIKVPLKIELRYDVRAVAARLS